MTIFRPVILASDAVRALLLHNDSLQGAFIWELEVASNRYGYLPMYPLPALNALDQFLSTTDKQARLQLFSFISNIVEESYMGIPIDKDIKLATQYLLQSKTTASFADIIGLAMAVRLKAPVLTQDQELTAFIQRVAHKVLLPPFLDTLAKTTREDKHM